MDFQEAVTANYTQPVISPSGVTYDIDQLVTEAMRSDYMWSSLDVLGTWQLAHIDTPFVYQLPEAYFFGSFKTTGSDV